MTDANKLPLREQVGIPSIQRYVDNLVNPDREFRPLPEPTQRWMCPECDYQHTKMPYDMEVYRCCSCEWSGNREQLLTSHSNKETDDVSSKKESD